MDCPPGAYGGSRTGEAGDATVMTAAGSFYGSEGPEACRPARCGGCRDFAAGARTVLLAKFQKLAGAQKCRKIRQRPWGACLQAGSACMEEVDIGLGARRVL